MLDCFVDLVLTHLVMSVLGEVSVVPLLTSPVPKSMHTYEDWIRRLTTKSLSFLMDQQMFRNMNGKAYDAAIDFLVHQKRLIEALPPPRKKRMFVLDEDDDSDYVIEHVPSGPKGQTTRVKVPRVLHSG